MAYPKLSESGALSKAGLVAAGLWPRAASIMLRPAAGGFINNAWNAAALGAAQATVANQTRISPIVAAEDITLDQLGASITSGTALATAKGVIYASDAAGRPSTILGETATMDASATATVLANLGAAVSLIAGRKYWIGIRASAIFTVNRLTGGACMVLGTSNAATPVPNLAMIKTETYANAAGDWGAYSDAQLTNSPPHLVLGRVA